MKVGVIGTGVMGRNHVRVYSELRDVDELYVYDVNQAAAEEVAAKNDAQVAPTFDALMDSVDAVSCCAPTPFHNELGQHILESGVHLLMEKPLCQTAAEAEELTAMIPKGLTVGVGHIERFNPIVSEICRIVKDPLYVEFKRHNPASSRINGSSVVEDLMIHDLDIVLHCLFAGQDYTIQKAGNYDLCAALFSFGSVPVYLSASRKASKKIRTVHIEQEDRTITGDFMNQEILAYWKPENYSVEDDRYVQENIIEKILVPKTEPLKAELMCFIDCVKTGKLFPITPEEATRNLGVCEQLTK